MEYEHGRWIIAGADLAQRRRTPIVQKERRVVSIATHGYGLAGNIHVYADGDITHVLAATDPPFLPTTDLNVHWLSDRTHLARFPFAMVNREQLVTIAEDSEPAASRRAQPEARSA